MFFGFVIAQYVDFKVEFYTTHKNHAQMNHAKNLPYLLDWQLLNFPYFFAFLTLCKNNFLNYLIS